MDWVEELVDALLLIMLFLFLWVTWHFGSFELAVIIALVLIMVELKNLREYIGEKTKSLTQS